MLVYQRVKNPFPTEVNIVLLGPPAGALENSLKKIHGDCCRCSRFLTDPLMT